MKADGQRSTPDNTCRRNTTGRHHYFYIIRLNHCIETACSVFDHKCHRISAYGTVCMRGNIGCGARRCTTIAKLPDILAILSSCGS